MSESSVRTVRSRLLRLWPWAVIALTVAQAVWHDVDFPDDVDMEYPTVVRPTFSRRPPPAYRLAEPGDTIDRIALYVAAGGVILSAWAWMRSRQLGRGANLWPAACGLSLAAAWYAATPGPTFDDWHGLGWRAIANPLTPTAVRVSLGLAGLGLVGLIIFAAASTRSRWAYLFSAARERHIVGLLIASFVLTLMRQFEIPGVEPAGYWPRWALVCGMIALVVAFVRIMPPLPRGLGRVATLAACVGVWFGLVVGGIDLVRYHRPLERLRTVAPGRIYISAMPTHRGLEISHERHHFKTIINLFPEETLLRSPRLPEELRFAREHGIHYLSSPGDFAQADEFLDETLRLAQDPSAWPILVHCHGCMDRTPAWMGVYRFVVQGRPLEAILREIEQHRGYRPKASVILLYNRVLPRYAPGRYALDPTSRLLKACARGVTDRLPAAEMARANPRDRGRVPPHAAPGRRP